MNHAIKINGWSPRDALWELVPQSRSDPDSKQKTETKFTFWYVLLDFIHYEPFSRKQKQKQVCDSLTFECVTICDICDQNVTKSVMLKKLGKIQSNKFGHKFEIVTFCDRPKIHKLSHIECDRYKPYFCFYLQSGSERLSVEGMKAEQKRREKKDLWSQPKKKPARAGWPKRLGLVRATPWADFAVITDQL